MSKRPDVMAEIGLGLAGFVSWRLIDAETGVVKRESPPHPNIILDAGITRWINGGEVSPQTGHLLDSCRVGTDDTAPAVTDTSLGTQVAETISKVESNSGVQLDVGVPEYYSWWQITYEFGKSEANDNLTEVAVARPTGSGTAHWTRQLFVDAAGDPTVITKTNSEILQVRYEVRLYADLVDPIKSTSLDVDERGTPVTTTIQYQPEDLDREDAYQIRGLWTTDYHDSCYAYEDNTPRDDGAGGPLWTGKGPASSGTSDFLREALDELSVSFTKDAPNQNVDITWTIPSGVANFTTGIGALSFPVLRFTNSDSTSFILFFDPKLDKTDTDEVTVTVRFNISRATI